MLRFPPLLSLRPRWEERTYFIEGTDHYLVHMRELLQHMHWKPACSRRKDIGERYPTFLWTSSLSGIRTSDLPQATLFNHFEVLNSDDDLRINC